MDEEVLSVMGPPYGDEGNYAVHRMFPGRCTALPAWYAQHGDSVNMTNLISRDNNKVIRRASPLYVSENGNKALSNDSVILIAGLVAWFLMHFSLKTCARLKGRELLVGLGHRVNYRMESWALRWNFFATVAPFPGHLVAYSSTWSTTTTYQVQAEPWADKYGKPSERTQFICGLTSCQWMNIWLAGRLESVRLTC